MGGLADRLRNFKCFIAHPQGMDGLSIPLEPLDIAIIGAYLVGIVGVGLAFSKKADGVSSFFLGSRQLPWWALSASGMASNLDLTGTTINTAFIYSFGLSGFFIEIRGGVTLPLAFFMAFMGKWLRRSGAVTIAEWMGLRFGNGLPGRMARMASAACILLHSTAMVAYFCIGTGQFIAMFLPEDVLIDGILGLSAERIAAAGMVGLALSYTVASGIHGVVWTDGFQAVLVFLVITFVCIRAWLLVDLPPAFEVGMPSWDPIDPSPGISPCTVPSAGGNFTGAAVTTSSTDWGSLLRPKAFNM
eukprot:gene5505-5496_t